MAKDAIQPGDVVKLTSGSPLMVVDEVLPKRALCFWWAGKRRGPVNAWLSLSVLIVVPQSE
jgi:uncharacterized protein YodC (DUF2158 family)